MPRFRKASEPQARVIDLTDAFHVSVAPPAASLPRNVVKNQRYTWWTYPVLSPLRQFLIFSNQYFLVSAVTQLFPALVVGYAFSYYVPLIIVVLISVAKEGSDEYRRWRSDRRTNSEPFARVHADAAAGALRIACRRARDIEVGDLLLLTKGQRIPADVVLLASLNDDVCYVKTQNLDGESDLRLKRPLFASAGVFGGAPGGCEASPLSVDLRQAFAAADGPEGSPPAGGPVHAHALHAHDAPHGLHAKRRHPKPGKGFHTSVLAQPMPSSVSLETLAANIRGNLPTISAVYRVERPSKDIYSLRATGVRAQPLRPLQPSQPGAPVPAPAAAHPGAFPITLDNSIWADCTLASSTVLGLVIGTGAETRSRMNVLRPRAKVGKTDVEINMYIKALFLVEVLVAALSTLLSPRSLWGFVTFLRWLLLYNNFIPISYKVAVDVGKLVTSYGIANDRGRIPGVVVRATDLTEQLGRISYVFSDKTGTLTRNEMRVRDLHVRDGRLHGKEGMREAVAALRARGQAQGQGGNGDGDASRAHAHLHPQASRGLPRVDGSSSSDNIQLYASGSAYGMHAGPTGQGGNPLSGRLRVDAIPPQAPSADFAQQSLLVGASQGSSMVLDHEERPPGRPSRAAATAAASGEGLLAGMDIGDSGPSESTDTAHAPEAAPAPGLSALLAPGPCPVPSTLNVAALEATYAFKRRTHDAERLFNTLMCISVCHNVRIRQLSDMTAEQIDFLKSFSLLVQRLGAHQLSVPSQMNLSSLAPSMADLSTLSNGGPGAPGAPGGLEAHRAQSFLGGDSFTGTDAQEPRVAGAAWDQHEHTDAAFRGLAPPKPRMFAGIGTGTGAGVDAAKAGPEPPAAPSFEDSLDEFLDTLYQASSPDELALVKYAYRCGFRLQKSTEDELVVDISELGGAPRQPPAPEDGLLRFTVIRVFPFNSVSKRMGVLVRFCAPGGPGGAAPTVRLFVKGADEAVVQTLSREYMRAYSPGGPPGGAPVGGPPGGGRGDPTLAPAPGARSPPPSPAGPGPGAPADPRAGELAALDASLAYLSQQGLRTLVYAYRDVPLAEFDLLEQEYMAAMADLERRDARCAAYEDRLVRGLTLLGVSGVEDLLQEGVTDTVGMLRRAGIRTWILSGDKVATVQAIARSCGLVRPVGTEYYHVTEPVCRGDYAAGVALLRQLEARVDALDALARAPAGAGDREDAGDRDLVLVLDGQSIECLLGSRPVTYFLSHALDPADHQTLHRLPLHARLRRRALAHAHRYLLGAPPRGRGSLYGLGRGGELLDARELFARVASRVSTVIACRCTPSQKALLSALVTRYTGRESLGIGDGANDVSLITTCSVGVGLQGREGGQAAASADYAATHFAALQPLLFYHGRHAYTNTCTVMQYVIMRGIGQCLLQLLFSASFYFTTVVLYTGVQIILLPTLYTMMTCECLYLDEDVDYADLMRHPELYAAIRRGRGLGLRAFLLWLAACMLIAAVIVGTLFLFDPRPAFADYVCSSFTAYILLEQLLIFVVYKRPSWFLVFWQAVSFVILYASMWAFSLGWGYSFLLSARYIKQSYVAVLAAGVPLIVGQLLCRRFGLDRATRTLRSRRARRQTLLRCGRRVCRYFSVLHNKASTGSNFLNISDEVQDIILCNRGGKSCSKK